MMNPLKIVLVVVSGVALLAACGSNSGTAAKPRHTSKPAAAAVAPTGTPSTAPPATAPPTSAPAPAPPTAPATAPAPPPQTAPPPPPPAAAFNDGDIDNRGGASDGDGNG